jgi:hypothetical protein
VVDATGKPVTMEEIMLDDKGKRTTPGASLLLARFRPLLPLFQDLENRTNIRFLDMFFTMHERYKDYRTTMNKVIKAWNSVLSDVPTPWLSGKGRRMFNESVSYIMMSEKERKALSKQEGFEFKHIPSKENEYGNIRWYAERQKNEMGLKESVQEIEQKMKEAAVVGRIILNWPVKSKMIPFRIYREHYLTMLRKFSTRTNKDISFEQYVRNQYKNPDLLSELHTNKEVAEDYVEDIINMSDSIRAMSKRGFTTAGMAKNFVEFQRKVDAAWGQEQGLIRETDFEMILDAYFRSTLRKIFFQDMAPLIGTWMGKMQREIEDSATRDQYNSIMADFMDSILGVPEASAAAMRQMNMRSTKYTAGKLVNLFADVWNGVHPATRKGRVGKALTDYTSRRWEVPERITPLDTFNGLSSIVYAWYIGLTPFNFNFMSPLKNIATQNVMSGIMGFDNYLKALEMVAKMRFNDPEALKYKDQLDELQLRVEFAPTPLGGEYIGKGGLEALTSRMMSVFKASDELNVQTAAMNALLAWEKLENYLKETNDPKGERITRAKMDEVLNLKTNKNIDDAKIMDSERNIEWANEWKSEAAGAFRGLSFELFDRVRKGNVDEARRIFIQYSVNISQWLYGAGGSPVFLRNPAIKMLMMFTTWPLNNAEFMFMVMRPSNGLLRRWLGVGLAQWLIASFLTMFVGIPAWKWIGMGTAPESLGLMGPLAQFVTDGYEFIRQAGLAGQAQVAPISSEERDRYNSIMMQRWEDLTSD